MKGRTIVILITGLSATAAFCAEPQTAGEAARNSGGFRGPQRNGIFASQGLLKQWPEGGPMLLWEGQVPGWRQSSAIAMVGEPSSGVDRLYEFTADGMAFVDAEHALRHLFGPAIEHVSQAAISSAIVRLAEGLPPGGAIDLPRGVPCGVLDFRRVADGVQVTRGHGGRLVLGPGQRGIQMVLMDLDQEIAAAPAAGAAASGPAPAARSEPASRPGLEIAILDSKIAPASDLLALFCNGGIHINSHVRNCAWICGANAFGAKAVTADARVDDCLFLWFGVNWAFQDYNAHRAPKNAGRDWLQNAQMWFNCKGGGQGTRLYLMVETNYGNPGPGVVLENCTGMAVYHGSTERASSQGPGVYWLRNCRNVQVGLRALNAFADWGPRGANPTHDITVEGGSGNILHAARMWNHASGATLVNTDPQLQVWMTSFEFEAEGLEGDGNLRFACTPRHQAPSPGLLATIKPEVRQRAEKALRDRGLEATPERLADMERQILTGRTYFAPFNARHEQTFLYGGVDLTKSLRALPEGRRLPPPPSVPPANAPRLRRPLAFTQVAGFGKALLEAGADPTGRKPSDDSFAKLMFGMTRDEVDKHYQEILACGQDYEKARAKADEAAEKVALAGIHAAVDQIWPKTDAPAGKRGRTPRPPIEVPPGTFLLTKPLIVWTNGFFMGAGPDRTILRATGDFPVIKQVACTTIGNFTVEGGHTGLAITGADHSSKLPAPLKSYIAAANYYNITFRNQTFAGLHLGNEDTTVMGGAEFDQNKFVDLRFHNTGDYGIYNNSGMVDKFLILHGHFEGQKKAGMAFRFNFLCKAGIYGCTFRNIGGPGIDLMTGCPQVTDKDFVLRPSIIAVDQCEFDECGSEARAALDQGYNSLTSFTHSRITTRSKTIKAGYVGAAQIIEDIDINVKVPGNVPAMVLRAVRNNTDARANGQVLRDVRASGPVAFINDTNEHNEVYEPSRTKRGFGKGRDIDWDRNPAVHQYPPPNGWVHPFVFFNCRFGNRSYDYVLLNVDPKHNRILSEVDLSPLSGRPSSTTPAQAAVRTWKCTAIDALARSRTEKEFPWDG
jgi:hypothetical protein